MRSFYLYPGALMICFIAAASPCDAKTTHAIARSIAPRSSLSSKNIQALEERLLPYFQQRLNHVHPVSPLHEGDLFLIAKSWNSLSKEFKTLYSQSTSIPAGYTSYASPGGHFEVYYTTTLYGRVDPADAYGFGAGGDWRLKNAQPDGVPDYVDEVAWALDSAWSMEVDRFRYVQPIPSTDATHPSKKFKVVVTTQDPGYYGQTFPDNPTGSHGFSSHMEIRNEWSDPDWSGTGYDTIPYNGARVTCAHEFFHTIQYAMAWNLNTDASPDSFPLSWIEGTAVMMEGLAFEPVHDYIQYASDYFDDPTLSILDPSDTSITVYSNSLITKFLHEFYSPLPDNDFIRQVFFNDYTAPINFYKDLRTVASSVGMPWVDILNGFHTRSFFTGKRAFSGGFIYDAPLLPQWSFSYDNIGSSQTITKLVSPYGMQVFAFQQKQARSDTLDITFQGERPAGAASTNPVWSASCILERLNGTDTVVHFTFANETFAALEIPSWHSLSDALVIVSNGDIGSSHNASIVIQTCPVTIPAGSKQAFVASTPVDTAILTVSAFANLRCSLSIAAIKIDSLIANAARRKLFAATGLFTISFPALWSTQSSMTLAISSRVYFPTTPRGLSLYAWLDTGWSKVSDSALYVNQSLHASASIARPGIYCLFYSSTSAGPIGAIAIYPNPAHLKGGSSVSINGKNILELWVYDMTGALVTHGQSGKQLSPASLPESSTGFLWLLTNGAGKFVTPGMYYVCLNYKDNITQEVVKKRQKVLVIP